MTRHKHAQTGLGIPSPLDRWINAMLRVLAMLLSNVASIFRMKARRAPVNATPTMPRDLPARTNDTQSKETNFAVQHDSLTSAHAEQRIADARPSKHERVLTNLEADLQSAFPAKAGIQTHDQKSARSVHSGPTPSQAMRLLKQLALNKNALT